MYTEEQLSQLEQEEFAITEEAIAIMILMLANSKKDIEKELRNFYQKYGKDGVVTYKEARKWVGEEDHRKRLLVLYLAIDTIFQSTHPHLEREFEKFLTEVIGMEEKMFNAKVDKAKVLAVKWGEDNLNWMQRLKDDIDLWLMRIENDIKVGILQQHTIDDILERLNKRFKSMSSVLRTLGITESTAVGSIARKELFSELGIKKYRYFARIDERTCEYCGTLHGTVFPISEFEVGVTASPIHPHCRCWEEPIME